MPTKRADNASIRFIDILSALHQSIVKEDVARFYISKSVWKHIIQARKPLQTRLLCTTSKTALHNKQAHFANKTSLTCHRLRMQGNEKRGIPAISVCRNAAQISISRFYDVKTFYRLTCTRVMW